MYYGDFYKESERLVCFGGNEVKLMGMSFVFNQDNFVFRLIDREYDSLELISIGQCILKSVYSINDKGFISEDSLSKIFLVGVASFLSEFGYRFSPLGQSEICYTMWYNFIYLHYYYLVEKFLDDYKHERVKGDFLMEIYKDGIEDILGELDTLKTNFKSRLEQYLKLQIQVRGISIIENTYMGFDTEYQLKDEKKFLNDLVSVQTAIQRRFLLRMPLYRPYDISYVHPLTS